MAKTKMQVTDDDRELVLELARKYLRTGKHPSIQRWAWEKILPFALPRLSAQELKTADKGFKIVVEDYRDEDVMALGAEIDIAEMPVMHTTLGKIPLPDEEEEK